MFKRHDLIGLIYCGGKLYAFRVSKIKGQEIVSKAFLILGLNMTQLCLLFEAFIE